MKTVTQLGNEALGAAAGENSALPDYVDVFREVCRHVAPNTHYGQLVGMFAPRADAPRGIARMGEAAHRLGLDARQWNSADLASARGKGKYSLVAQDGDGWVMAAVTRRRMRPPGPYQRR